MRLKANSEVSLPAFAMEERGSRRIIRTKYSSWQIGVMPLNYICHAGQRLGSGRKIMHFHDLVLDSNSKLPKKRAKMIILGGDQINYDTLELFRRGQEEELNGGC